MSDEASRFWQAACDFRSGDRDRYLSGAIALYNLSQDADNPDIQLMASGVLGSGPGMRIVAVPRFVAEEAFADRGAREGWPVHTA